MSSGPSLEQIKRPMKLKSTQFNTLKKRLKELIYFIISLSNHSIEGPIVQEKVKDVRIDFVIKMVFTIVFSSAIGSIYDPTRGKTTRFNEQFSSCIDL